MPHKIIVLLSIILLAIGCKTPEARRPVQQNSKTFFDVSKERNKKLYEAERDQILAIIAKDAAKSYETSDTGFWYYYNVKDTITSETPDFGDEVTFTYNIERLNGEVVLTAEENGLQSYKVEQNNQELISGIRDGIKLMKNGETITFLFPSYKAYGYYGIPDKLGANVPVKSTITLQSIDKTTEN